AERDAVVERVAGCFLTLRVALVEQRLHFARIELGLRLRLRLRRPLRRSRNILRLLLVGLLLLRLLGGVLLERLGDEIALGLGLFLRFLLGLRRRWRRRRIGRGADLLGRDLGGGILDRVLLLVDFLHQRLRLLLGCSRRALRHLAGGGV